MYSEFLVTDIQIEETFTDEVHFTLSTKNTKNGQKIPYAN